MPQIIYRVLIKPAQMPAIRFDFHLHVMIITAAWIQSGHERILSCTGHHTLSPFLFLHACLRSRGTVPVSLWLGIAHKISCAKAGRRIMIDVTHQLTPREAPRRGNGFGLGLLLNLSLQVNQRSSFSLFLGECKSIPHGSNVSKQNIASLAFFLLCILVPTLLHTWGKIMSFIRQGNLLPFIGGGFHGGWGSIWAVWCDVAPYMRHLNQY